MVEMEKEGVGVCELESVVEIVKGAVRVFELH